MQVFGITKWKSEGSKNTSRGLRYLYTAPAPANCGVLEDACSSGALDELGIDCSNVGLGYGTVKWWKKPGPEMAQDVIDQICQDALIAGAAYRAEIEERVARNEAYRARERQAALDAIEAAKAAALARPGILLGQIRELVRDWLWLFNPEHAERAVKLAQVEPLVNMWLAEDLIARARKTLKRIQKRLSEPTDEQLLALCQSPPVREAAHAACKMLSSCDHDRAAEANGYGWSKATTTTGHYLSRLPSMTPAQAAHGLRLLTVHRKQLPRDMAEEIFNAKQETIEMTEKKSYTPKRKPWTPVAQRPKETAAEMEARYAKEEADWHFITAGIVPPVPATQR